MASLKNLIKNCVVLQMRAASVLAGKTPRFVLLLGHMRSGSTLLAHLLFSHPQVVGAGERSQPVGSSADLRALVWEAARHSDRLFRSIDRVVDQINHTRFTPSLRLLDREDIDVVILVREPHAAISSMCDVLGKHYDMTLDEAVDYYLERTRDLARIATSLARAPLVVDYEELTESSSETLARLTSHLRLDSPLADEYQLFPFTGRRGDPSAVIQSGRIISRSDRQLVSIPPRKLAMAQLAYDTCRRAWLQDGSVL